jgi:hypothetical protein
MLSISTPPFPDPSRSNLPEKNTTSAFAMRTNSRQLQLQPLSSLGRDRMLDINAKRNGSLDTSQHQLVEESLTPEKSESSAMQNTLEAVEMIT